MDDTSPYKEKANLLEEGNRLLGKRLDEEFEIVAVLSAKQVAVVQLMYKEVLQRNEGLYQPELYFSTSHPVETFFVMMIIKDVQLTTLRAAPLKEEQLKAEGKASIDLSENATVSLVPKSSEVWCSIEEYVVGISARFAIEFDVYHHRGGEIFFIDDYFVHTFVPDNLWKTVSTDVLFFLAVSESDHAWFEKIKKGMVKILRTFGHGSDNRFFITAESNITPKLRKYFFYEEKIDTFTFNVSATGLNFIKKAFDLNFELLHEYASRFHFRPCVVFLVTTKVYADTDEAEQRRILHKMKYENKIPCGIFSVALGVPVTDSIRFLQTLSLQNFGYAKKIYDVAGADTELLSLVTDVFPVDIEDMTITYDRRRVNETSLSKTIFSKVLNGTEVTVCGRLLDSNKPFSYDIKAPVKFGIYQETLLFEDYNAKLSSPRFVSLVSDMCEALKFMQDGN